MALITAHRKRIRYEATLHALAYHKPSKLAEREPDEEPDAAETAHEVLKWAHAMKNQVKGE